MALTQQALEKAEREATAAAERQVVAALERLVKELPVLCTVVRPTERPVWVLELNPPEAGTVRNLAYRTEKARAK